MVSKFKIDVIGVPFVAVVPLESTLLQRNN